MGSNPCRKFQLLDIAHPVVGKQFQVLEVYRAKLIQDLSGEGKAIFGLVFLLCKF